MTSVLQDWVMELPLRAQGTLVAGIRGCDLALKNPCDIDEQFGCSTGESTVERGLSAFLRFCTLNTPDPREIGMPGAWIQPAPPWDWKPSQLGHYPLHWYSHLMHSFEVVGYMHPDEFGLAETAATIYYRLVENLHLHPESRNEMIARLTADRVAAGTVVT